MTETVVRFLVGGCIVSVFAMLADVLRPKSFAGLFGAAPSVALASLWLSVVHHGAGYAQLQSRSMLAGAAALGVYSLIVCTLLMVRHWHAIPATVVCLFAWFVVVFALLGISA